LINGYGTNSGAAGAITPPAGQVAVQRSGSNALATGTETVGAGATGTRTATAVNGGGVNSLAVSMVCH
jgi:hypothetical protein